MAEFGRFAPILKCFEKLSTELLAGKPVGKFAGKTVSHFYLRPEFFWILLSVSH